MKTKTKIRFGFKNKNQLYWFMVWREFWENGEVVHASVIFKIVGWHLVRN